MAKWGASQVEFRALWAEVKDRLENGERLNTIYGKLSDAGRITMSRSAFYKIHKSMEAAPGKGAAQRQRVPAATAARPMPANKLPAKPAPNAASGLPTLEFQELRPLSERDGDLWGRPGDQPNGAAEDEDTAPLSNPDPSIPDDKTP